MLYLDYWAASFLMKMPFELLVFCSIEHTTALIQRYPIYSVAHKVGRHIYENFSRIGEIEIIDHKIRGE